MTDATPSQALAASPQRVVLLGHRSFAATGLAERLRAAGHTVITFHRGPAARDGDTVTGDMLDMAGHPDLKNERADVLINFALLKDDPAEPNERFIDALATLVATLGIQHIVHMSSISSFADVPGRITEASPEETNPDAKGAYGSIKVAQDLRLRHHFDKPDSSVALTLVRPGFILGPGVVNPIIGNGIRLGNNRLLVLGAANHTLPVTTRDKVHETVEKILRVPPPTTTPAVYLVADKGSPTRRAYLQAACEQLGVAEKVWSFPRLLWRSAGLGGEVFAKCVGMSLRPNRPIKAACNVQSFDPSKTEHALDVSYAVDWINALRTSQEGQDFQADLPYGDAPRDTKLSFDAVNFVGCGRIVDARHEPSLQRLGFTGPRVGYDLDATLQRSIPVKPLDTLQPDAVPASTLTVVATPGHIHKHALPLAEKLPGPLLIEKPLGINAEELDAWHAAADQREAPIYVCHNYRYKQNVRQMINHLQTHRPGRLIHARLDFHSPPAAFDGVPWLRRERASRTLLLDYSIHLLDIACMFSRQDWSVAHEEHELNTRHETAVIQARLQGTHYPVDLLLRQGFMPRRATVDFTFENYVVHLGFFPDSFAVQMGDLSPAYRRQQAKAAGKATRRKILDKVLGQDHDDSHERVYAGLGHDATDGLRVQALRGFYSGLFELSDRVYGDA